MFVYDSATIINYYVYPVHIKLNRIKKVYNKKANTFYTCRYGIQQVSKIVMAKTTAIPERKTCATGTGACTVY